MYGQKFKKFAGIRCCNLEEFASIIYSNWCMRENCE